MLEIKKVTIGFSSNNNLSVVEEVSLDIKPGTKNVIIGETGSGKSVLLLAVLGLLPSTANISGRIILDGQDILKVGEKALQKIRGSRIAYIPQGSGNGMNPLLTIGFQVGEPTMEHLGYTRKKALERSKELLRLFGIKEPSRAVKCYPHMFSGGMKQRAMISMGISAGAKIILADEPTKGLDYERIHMVAECFNNLKEQTILCVTHDIIFASKIADYISVMYAAQQIEYACKEEVLENPLHPYTKLMINAMPENGLKCSMGFAPPHNLYETNGCRFKKRCPYSYQKCSDNPPEIFINNHMVRCWLYDN